MSQPSAALRPGPDRIITRAAARMLVVWLLLVLADTVVMDRAWDRHRSAAAEALRSEQAAGHGRALAAALDLMVRLPSRDVPQAARDRAARDGAGLMSAIDARGEEPVPALPAGARAAAQAAIDLVAARPSAAPGVPEIRDRVESLLVPALEHAAERARTASDDATAAMRTTLLVTLSLQLAGTLALALTVLMPARARVTAWVSRSAETERENRFRLLHDPLTELPNATYLHAYLARVAAGAARSTAQTAVLRVGLDRFRFLQATLGTRACDEILRVAARRISHALRAGDFAAHLGQDDFVVVTGEITDGNDVASIAARLQAALSKPFALREGARTLSCGIGVTLLSDDAAEPERILANAGIALAAAQEAGTGCVRYFREGLRLEVERRAALYGELLVGLERGEFRAFFQPQRSLVTGAFTGFEALTRWEHPERGLLVPSDFLDFAEETGVTGRLGELMLTQTLQALQQWDAAGLPVPRVGVNFALAQLRDPRLVEKIKWETERFDIDPSRVAIEVLETVLIKSDTDLVVRNLRGLASAGFRVELDDFGTGHASISNLRRFLVERIKIDRSFIAGIEASGEQQQLTASMIAMANALGIRTLAEGVESEAAVAVLRRLGCDEFQGYLTARAMPLSETFDWLRHQGLQAPAAGGSRDPNSA